MSLQRQRKAILKFFFKNCSWILAISGAITTSISVSPRFCRAGTWYERGPAVGGRLSGIVASPTDPNVLIVSSPGGGIWRTNNNGATWFKTQNLGLTDFNVLHLEWDQTRPGRLYASTYSGLFASTDMGDHWQILSGIEPGPVPFMPSASISDPRPFTQMNIGGGASSMIFWSKPCSGLYYSTDGVSVRHIWPFEGGSTNLDNCISTIAADEATGKVYFGTMSDRGHIFRSTQGWSGTTTTVTWERITTGIPNDYGTYITSIAYTGQANRLLAVVNASGNWQVVTLTSSASWRLVPQQPQGRQDIRTLVSLGGDQVAIGSIWLLTTRDYGNTPWRENRLSTPQGSMHADVRAIHWHRYSSGQAYFWATTDGGMPSQDTLNIVRWNLSPTGELSMGTSIPTSGIKVWQAYYAEVTALDRSRNRLFVGSQDNAGVCSDNGGMTWTNVPNPRVGDSADYFSFIISPSNPNRAYFKSNAVFEFYKSDDAASAATCETVHWQTIRPSTQLPSTNLVGRGTISVHPTQPDTIAFAGGGWTGVAVSSNAGANLSLHPLPGQADAASVYIDPNGAVYAGTIDHGVFRLDPRGSAWTNFALNSSSPKFVSQIAWSSAGQGEGTFFLGTSGGLYRKPPGGAWTLASALTGSVVSAVEVDPHCPTRIYAGMGWAGMFGQQTGGVSVSSDAGETWRSLSTGWDLHQSPITDIRVDPINSRYVYVATYGRGALTYDYGSTPICGPPPSVAPPSATIVAPSILLAPVIRPVPLSAPLPTVITVPLLPSSPKARPTSTK